MTSPAVEIYEGQDFYIPYFEVKIGEKRLERDVVFDIIQVTYKDTIEELDSFEITINNWDAEKRAFKYSDQPLFDPGKKIELLMGYRGKDPLRLMLTGEVKSLRPTFPAAGQPTLAISGLNLLDQLRRGQVSHTYEKLTDSQIANQIATRIGAEVQLDANAARDEKQYPYLFQENQYDILFLWERARRIGYDLFVVEPEDGRSGQKPKFYFGPSKAIKRPTYRLTYGRSLTQFQPDLTTTNQVSAVTVRGWNAKTKEKIEATVTRKQIDNKGVTEKGGQAQIDASFANRKEVIATKPVADKAEAEKLARETLERIAKDMVKGSGVTVGLPDLRAGSVVEIDGLGKRFSGRYFVTGTTHTIGDGGYTTQFECRREET